MRGHRITRTMGRPCELAIRRVSFQVDIVPRSPSDGRTKAVLHELEAIVQSSFAGKGA
jgi:hypothetical protein